jgi:hypothetical protein
MATHALCRNAGLAAFTLSALAGFAPVHAQAGDEPKRDVQACAEIQSEEARLACFDAAVRSAPVPDAVPGRDEAAGDASGVPEVDASATPKRDEPRRERRDRQDEQGFWITVVDVRENLSGLAVFTTDDGRVFVQTSTRPARYGDTPFRARVEPAKFGSYFLRPENVRQRLRVNLRD